MSIKQQTPLTLAEVADLAGDSATEVKIKSFVKKFVKMNVKKAKEMKEELKKLGVLKLKDENLVKIVDFTPEDAVDLNKVLPEVSLNQEEVNKILEVVKKY